MVNYFQVLGIPETADRGDVKRAYRELAKEWHPDRNSDPKAPAAFILINEAYEFLLDDSRRESHRLGRATDERAEAIRRMREERYKEWVEQSRKAARERAASHAKQSFDQFQGSRLYRTAMVLNRLYDYLFLGLGCVIVAVPILVMNRPAEEREKFTSTTYATMGLTMFMGLLFTYFIWKFLFNERNEE
jgi:hypothetical protein